jgi:ferritin-like protein
MSEAFSHSASPGDASAAAQPLGRRPAPTRAQLLARAVAAGAALSAGAILLGGLPKLAVSKPSAEQDARVLEWLLQIEYLQAGFYTEAGDRGALKGELREFASLVGEQERAHVEALEKALGGNAPAKPSLDFGDATTDPAKFVPAAVKLEEIGLAAFNGQAPNLTKKPLLTALKIVSVEARHTGWIRDLAGRIPAPRPADPPATQAQTNAAIRETGFVE